MRTRVKICGITRASDADAAIRLGTDAIGLVFYPPSPRAVTQTQAQQILERIPPFVAVVGLFVDQPRPDIELILDKIPIDLLQFHGQESPADCAGYDRPWIKAISMHHGVDLQRARDEYAAARALLLDAYQPGIPGGTGTSFEWSRIPKNLSDQIILAGGLNPDNVAEAITQVRPYAVDVSGGVEQAKGIKDPAKIAAFLRGVRSGDESRT